MKKNTFVAVFGWVLFGIFFLVFIALLATGRLTVNRETNTFVTGNSDLVIDEPLMPQSDTINARQLADTMSESGKDLLIARVEAELLFVTPPQLTNNGTYFVCPFAAVLPKVSDYGTIETESISADGSSYTVSISGVTPDAAADYMDWIVDDEFFINVTYESDSYFTASSDWSFYELVIMYDQDDTLWVNVKLENDYIVYKTLMGEYKYES